MIKLNLNASRLILMNINLDERHIDLSQDIDIEKVDLYTKWIISKFNSTLKNVDSAIEQYRFSEAENLIYDFFWGNFCDWYLEIIKNSFNKEEISKVAFALLENSLRMMSPFIPFVTEEVWEHLNIDEGPLSTQKWPIVNKKLINKKCEEQMQILINVVTTIRNLKAEWNIKTTQKIDCLFVSKNDEQLNILKENEDTLKLLLKADEILFEEKQSITKNSATGIVGDIKIYLPLGDIIDVSKEKGRIKNETVSLEKLMKGLAGRLKNKDFLKKAPKDVVEKDKSRLRELEAKIKGLKETVNNLD